MAVIDTHAHLNDKSFDKDIEQVIARCIQNNIKEIYIPNINVATIKPMLALVEKHSNIKKQLALYPMLGLHPCYVDEHFEDSLTQIQNVLNQKINCFTAIGEIGLDSYHNAKNYTLQKKALQRQLQWAISHRLPVSLHLRTIEDIDVGIKTLTMLKKEHPSLKGIFHCFTGTLEQAEKIIELKDFYLGVGGIFTYKNNPVATLLTSIDLKHIVLETDSPYLAPGSYRGKRNEPAYLSYIIKRLAHTKGVSEEEVAKVSTANAQSVFSTQ